ncbi:hypothetical protein ACFWWT_06855 [Streptomyces sp. NPDC058676]|uniref:hypothetical protein n=1 Tax=unclassified Streptomyces TaxID=2593676 RepID=UPI00365A4B2E
MGEPKYLLLSYDGQAEFEGEEGYEETWALCQDADDLFADPPPPRRAVYELLGCAPEDRLTAALVRARAEGSAQLGALTPESSTGPAPRSGSGTSRTPTFSTSAPAPVT